jgi:hypothetical protein
MGTSLLRRRRLDAADLGGWGATPKGNNPASYLLASWDDFFGVGGSFSIGGGGGDALTFASAAIVQDYLPQGGTPALLPTDSVFAGQLTAATINVAADAFDGTGAVALSDLVYTDLCVHALLAGLSVAEIIVLANGVISGLVAVPAGLELSDISDALAVLNEQCVGPPFARCPPRPPRPARGRTRALGLTTARPGRLRASSCRPSSAREAQRHAAHPPTRALPAPNYRSPDHPAP